MSSQLEKECTYCKKVFYKRITCSLLNWSISKFCSKTCLNKNKIGKPSWNKGTVGIMKSNKTSFKKGHVNLVPPEARKRGSNNNMWKGGQVEISCITCNKLFKVDPYRKDKIKNCSKACSNVYRALPEVRLKRSEQARKQVLSQYGETPEFITKLSQIIRESAKYRLWREQVWKRDNYTCQMCLEQKGKICADHIISFLEVFLNEGIDSYDKAMKNGILWDISNGRTLCYDCHYKTENYGFKAIKSLKTNSKHICQ